MVYEKDLYKDIMQKMHSLSSGQGLISRISSNYGSLSSRINGFGYNRIKSLYGDLENSVIYDKDLGKDNYVGSSKGSKYNQYIGNKKYSVKGSVKGKSYSSKGSVSGKGAGSGSKGSGSGK